MSDTTLHKDGTVTYWSVYEQVWKRHETSVPDKELAAMADDERRAVGTHLVMPGHVARIVDVPDGYKWSDDALDYIDESGQTYPSKAAARRAAKEEGFVKFV